MSPHLKSIPGNSDEDSMSDEEKTEQRQYRRHPRRLACNYRVEGKELRGFITNVSARGFFIQARNHPEPGAEVIVTIEHEPTPPIVVTGTIARLRKTHRSMANIEQPGIGIQIDSAPEDYYQLVLDMEQKE